MYLTPEMLETDKTFLQALMLEILEDWNIELANEELDRLAGELAEGAISFLNEDEYDEEGVMEDIQGELF